MKITLIFYVLNVFAMFLSRSIFVNSLGADISGLNSLFISLIGFLNVAELGIGIAIGYSLYKPLSICDYERVNEIMILFKQYYIKIAKRVFIIGISTSIFLPILIKGQVPLIDSYIYYLIYILNCTLSYLFTYKQTLIIADQKQYKIVIRSNSVNFLKILIQCIQLLVIPSFFIWLILELIFNLFAMYIVNKKIDYEYYGKVTYKSSKTFKEIENSNIKILKNIKDIFFHKIGGFVIFQTDTIIISIFSTLKETAIYGNYIMIINAINGIISNGIGCIMPGIGNLIAKESNEKIYSTFKKLYTLDHFIAFVVTFITYNLIDKFVELWVGKEYIFSNYIVIALMVNLYIKISRGTVDRFKDGFGIYWDVYVPILESIINIVLSLILTYKIGILGVFIGTIISNIIFVKLWKPKILFKEGFHKNIVFYWNQTLGLYLKNLIAFYIIKFTIDKLSLIIKVENNFLDFFMNGAVISALVLIVSFVVYLLDYNFRCIIKDLMNRFNKKIKH
ncbi:hypothetical protein QTG87_09860 [Clostridium perfringens]|nr:hypothetical protein [Clostridium perfringens]